MANLIATSFSHTYAGVEYLSQLFYKPQEGRDNVFANYKVMPNVKTKINLYLPGTLAKVVRAYTTCGFSATGGTTTITDRVLDVNKVKVNLEECVDAVFDTVFEEAMKAGVQITDLSGTIIETIARTKVVEAIKSDVGRIAWFGKVGASSADYSMADGWVELFIDSSATLGQFFNMDSSSYETAGTLVTNGAYNALKYMYENQTKVLRQVAKKDKAFYVTATVIDNLTTTYEQLGTGNNLGLTMLMDGKQSLMFRGIPLIEVTGWDTDLADSDNPQAAFVGDNMIVLTMKDNLVIGTDVTDPSAELKFRFNDDDDEKMKITSKFKIGFQIIHPELVSFGY
ncbi:MAG: hypothetical protein ACO3EE_10730 [Flavobacteriales bacterium]